MSNYAQAAPVGAAVVAPVTPDIPAPAKPAAQQDFFAELVKEQEMADKLLSHAQAQWLYPTMTSTIT